MEINKKTGYEAPRIEAASFRTEQGYAVSEDPVTSATAKITMGGGTL